jgi:hypothetical protein
VIQRKSATGMKTLPIIKYKFSGMGTSVNNEYINEIEPGYQGVVIRIHVNPTNKKILLLRSLYFNVILIPIINEIEQKIRRVIPLIISKGEINF